MLSLVSLLVAPILRQRARVLHTTLFLSLISSSLWAGAADGAVVLAPGQEAKIEHMLSVDVVGCRLEGAQIASQGIEARYLCDNTEAVVTLHPPPSDAGRNNTPALRVEAAAAPAALIEALRKRIAESEHGFTWISPDAKAESTGHHHNLPVSVCGDSRHGSGFLVESSAVTQRAALTWLLLLGMLAGLRSPAGTAFPGRWRQQLVWIGVLGVFAAAAWLLADRGSLHEHQTFLARSDCAVSGSCDDDRPGWLPPTYHVYRILLLPLTASGRYDSDGIVGLSLLLTLVAASLQHGFLSRFFTRIGEPERGRRVAWASTIFVLANPVTLRLAVAMTFWPWAFCCFWASAWLWLLAEARGGWRAWLAAGCGLALTVTSAAPMMPALSMLMAWRWRRRLRSCPQLLGACIALISIGLHYFGEMHQGISLLQDFEPLSAMTTHIYSDPRVIAPSLSALACVGAIVLLKEPQLRVVLLPPVTGLLLITFSFDEQYPSALLHGFLPIVLFGTWAGCGVEFCSRVWREGRPRRFGFATLVVLTLAGWIGTDEGWRALRQPRPVAAELAAIEFALPRLPRHEVLVIPPAFETPLTEAAWGEERLEVRFPCGFYKEVMRRRGIEPARVVWLDEWLDEPTPPESTLVYLGGTLASFTKHEVDIAEERGLERPLLHTLRRRGRLEPVETFEVATDSHPAVTTRLAADRVPAVTLGFYRLRMQ